MATLSPNTPNTPNTYNTYNTYNSQYSKYSQYSQHDAIAICLNASLYNSNSNSDVDQRVANQYIYAVNFNMELTHMSGRINRLIEALLTTFQEAAAVQQWYPQALYLFIKELRQVYRLHIDIDEVVIYHLLGTLKESAVITLLHIFNL